MLHLLGAELNKVYIPKLISKCKFYNEKLFENELNHIFQT